jgi:Skp family chaperone for outer membrane proteins
LTDINRWLNRKLVAAVMAATLISMTSATTFAQSTTPAAPPPAAPQPVVMGVMDVQFILTNAKAAKTVRAAVEKQAATYQAELAQQENAIRTADQQLQQQRAALTSQDYEAKKAELGQKVEALRQKAASRNKQLQQMDNGAMTQVEQALFQTTADIAKARGLTLVLNKAMVVLNVTSYDITKEALQKLDARLTSVKLPPPQ